MKSIQVTLTVEEGKEIIALGILNHKKFNHSLKNGKILLKGGTTVSRISEKAIALPLRISGRITERGTVAELGLSKTAHTVLISGNKILDIDNTIDSEIIEFGPSDLIITGANAIDSNGNAAIMAGSPGGGLVGKSIQAWYTEGANIIIAVGIEKLIPGNILTIINKTNRKNKFLSWGMSVGLIPLMGEIVTETEAVELLADVECFAIAAGGLGKANGSTTLQISGNDEEIAKVIEIIKSIKNDSILISGDKESLLECKAHCINCHQHLGCGYKSGVL
jgi:hypothetical protein